MSISTLRGNLSERYTKVGRLEALYGEAFNPFPDKDIRAIGAYKECGLLLVADKVNPTEVKLYGFNDFANAVSLRPLGVHTIADGGIYDFEVVNDTVILLGTNKVYYVDVTSFSATSIAFSQPTSTNMEVNGHITSKKKRLKRRLLSATKRGFAYYHYDHKLYVIDPADRTSIYIQPFEYFLTASLVMNKDHLLGARQLLENKLDVYRNGIKQPEPLTALPASSIFDEDHYLGTIVDVVSDSDDGATYKTLYVATFDGAVFEVPANGTAPKNLFTISGNLEKLVATPGYIIATTELNIIYLYNKATEEVEMITFDHPVVDIDTSTTLLYVLDCKGGIHIHKLLDFPKLLIKKVDFEIKYNEALNTKQNIINILAQLSIETNYVARNRTRYTVTVKNNEDQAIEYFYENGQMKNIYVPVTEANMKRMLSVPTENNVLKDLEIYILDESTGVRMLVESGIADNGIGGDSEANKFPDSRQMRKPTWEYKGTLPVTNIEDMRTLLASQQPNENLYVRSRENFSEPTHSNLSAWFKEATYKGFTVYSTTANGEGRSNGIGFSGTKTYTYSVYVKVDIDMTLAFKVPTVGGQATVIGRNTTQVMSGDYTRVEFTYSTTDSGVAYPQVYKTSPTGKLYIYGAKVEEGTTATSYNESRYDFIGFNDPTNKLNILSFSSTATGGDVRLRPTNFKYDLLEFGKSYTLSVNVLALPKVPGRTPTLTLGLFNENRLYPSKTLTTKKVISSLGQWQRISLTFKFEEDNFLGTGETINDKLSLHITTFPSLVPADIYISGCTLNEGLVELDEVIEDLQGRSKRLIYSKLQLKDLYVLNDELYFRARHLLTSNHSVIYTLPDYDSNTLEELPITEVSKQDHVSGAGSASRYYTIFEVPTTGKDAVDYTMYGWYKITLPNLDVSKLNRLRATIIDTNDRYAMSKEFYIKDLVDLRDHRTLQASFTDGAIRVNGTEYLSDFRNGPKDMYIRNFSNISFEKHMAGDQITTSRDKTIVNGEVMEGYLSFPMTYDAYQYKKNSLVTELYVAGKKAYRKYVRQLDNLQGGLTCFYPSDRLKEVLPKDEYTDLVNEGILPTKRDITVVAMKKNLIESEQLIVRHKISKQFQDEPAMLQSTGIYIPMKVTNDVSPDKMRIFIQDLETNYLVRVNPKNYRITLDRENQQALVIIKEGSYIFEGADLVIVSNGVLDDSIYYDKLDGPYDTDSVPLITFDEENNIYTGLTAKAEDLDINLNGLTLVPGIDFSVVEPKLAKSPTLILFRNILPKNSIMEVNVLNKGTNKIRVFKNPAVGTTNIFSIDDDSLVFFENGFEVFANNLRVPRKNIEIIDAKTIRINNTPSKDLINVMVRFSFEDHPSLKEILDMYKYNQMNSTSDYYHSKLETYRESNFDIFAKGASSTTAPKMTLLDKLKAKKGFVIDANIEDFTLPFDIKLDAEKIENQYITENLELDCNRILVNDVPVVWTNPEI